MPVIGIQHGEAQLSFADALAEAQAGTLPYPPPIISHLAKSRNDTVPSASNMATCLRQFMLKKQTPYYVKVSDSLAPIFGTAFHLLMEQERKENPDGGLSELRLKAKVDLGVYGTHETGGTVDYLLPPGLENGGGLVSDWKTKKYLPVQWEPTPEHKAQVHVYGWLAHENGYGMPGTWELVYASQSFMSTFRGKMLMAPLVQDWVRTRLMRWAVAEDTNTLPPPRRELFEHGRDGRAEGICGYCSVREACWEALRRETPSPFQPLTGHTYSVTIDLSETGKEANESTTTD